MKTRNVVIVLVVLVAIAGIAAYRTGVVSPKLLNHMGAGNDQQGKVDDTASATNSNAATTDAPDTPVALQQDYIEKLLATVTADQKKALLSDTAAFRRFIDQEVMNLSLLRAAQSSKLKSDEMTQFLVQRGADNVMREIYMTSFINSKIPRDYPNDEQIQQYYEKNKADIKVAERLSIWQIFLPIELGMDEAAIAAVAKEANRIAEEIKAGKLDFEAAALRYSRHEPSRLNGGYMGIMKMSELLPEVSKIINGLDSGESSAAIKSATGYHILRKGEVFPAQELTLDQIRGEIRNLLINQERIRLRDAINTEVMKTYPVTVDNLKVEEWRQQMLSGK